MNGINGYLASVANGIQLMPYGPNLISRYSYAFDRLKLQIHYILISSQLWFSTVIGHLANMSAEPSKPKTVIQGWQAWKTQSQYHVNVYTLLFASNLHLITSLSCTYWEVNTKYQFQTMANLAFNFITKMQSMLPTFYESQTISPHLYSVRSPSFSCMSLFLHSVLPTPNQILC